jgi:hypothetical protein
MKRLSRPDDETQLKNPSSPCWRASLRTSSFAIQTPKSSPSYWLTMPVTATPCAGSPPAIWP